VAALVRIEGRYADEAMDAAFRLEVAEGEIALDQ